MAEHMRTLRHLASASICSPGSALTGGGLRGGHRVSVIGPVRKQILQRRIRLIVAVTISYNVIEAAIALAA